MKRQCEFRFYEELGDFLPPDRRKRSFLHAFDGTPAVKDRIEALGVPHTEVDLILVDGEPVGFHHRLRGGERVAVYPMFECFELGSATRLRPTPLREPRFVLDVHLGRLASYLRLLGFDTLYRNNYDDEELLAISRAQHRILLSRDTGLLKRAALTHGAFLHATDPRRQLREVCDRFQLDARIAPFTRCARCNGMVEALAAESTAATDSGRQQLSHCRDCGQVYWPGSHLTRLRQRLGEVGVSIWQSVQRDNCPAMKPSENAASGTTANVRLDLWLWAARFFKTRALAKQAIETGKIEIGGQRAKPARGVRVGDALTIARGEEVFEIEVRALSNTRGPATVAQGLYFESEASRLRRESERAGRAAERAGYRAPETRPDKRARRLIRALGDIDAT